MRLPEFTAESSLSKASGNYTGFFTRASHGTSSVVAQLFDYSIFGADYWGNVADQYFFCRPPCGRDGMGHCHCPTVTSGQSGWIR